MSVQLGFVLLSLLVICKSTSMHGLPCSSLAHCFGNPSDVNTDPAPPQEPTSSGRSRNNNGLPVISQPEVSTGIPQAEDQQHKQPHRTVSCISSHSTGARKVNGINSNSACHLQDQNDDHCFESPPPCRSLSRSSEDDELEVECSPELDLKYPHIPRPSIIVRQPKVRRLLFSTNVLIFNWLLSFDCVLFPFFLLDPVAAAVDCRLNVTHDITTRWSIEPK